MGFIDLHVHSNASDGTMAPSMVVDFAIKKGLDAIALTDHDTISGIAEAEKAARHTCLEIIPGIELSCVYNKEEIHILGLFINPEDPVFKREIDKLLAIREKRNDDMIRLFCSAGMEMNRAELAGEEPGAAITRAHFARLLVDKGFAATMEQAFKKYLTYGGPYCLRKEIITPEQAMKILTDCGASPVLAHPYLYHLGDAKTEELVLFLKELGLQGIEVYHSSNNQYESGKLKDLAAKYQLFPTGGSDFHGNNKPDIEIGTGRGGLRISHLLLDNIKQVRKEKGTSN